MVKSRKNNLHLEVSNGVDLEYETASTKSKKTKKGKGKTLTLTKTNKVSLKAKPKKSGSVLVVNGKKIPLANSMWIYVKTYSEWIKIAVGINVNSHWLNIFGGYKLFIIWPSLRVFWRTLMTKLSTSAVCVQRARGRWNVHNSQLSVYRHNFRTEWKCEYLRPGS